MIDDVKDLSLIEKEKAIARKNISTYFWKCIFTALVASMAMTLFSMFILGNFLADFQKDSALMTSARFVSSFMVMVLLLFGTYKNSKEYKTSVRDFHLNTIMIVLTYILSLTTSVEFNMYAMPIALSTYVIIELTGRRNAILTTLITGVMMLMAFSAELEAYDLSIVASAIICNSLSAIVITFFEKKHLTRLKFLLMTVFTPLILQPLVVMFTMVGGDLTINILWNVLWSYGSNVGAALLFMPLVAIFEGVFNIADDFRLNELCNLSNPLLKRLASEAPGTFNHSLVVGNLAEACASAIGENPNLARCAAYYHDIGKLKAPIYFSENQSSYNPHDELIPEVSVSMITSHTLFGEILAKQNRLPQEIVAICREHHGTSPVGYFYRKALTLKEEGELAVDKYTYAGPKPQTKIAAIIMIADTIEAAMRAYMPDTKEEFEARSNKLVDEKLEMHQFDECPITMGDIAIIKRTIIEVMPSIHHSRVNYEKKQRVATFK